MNRHNQAVRSRSTESEYLLELTKPVESHKGVWEAGKWAFSEAFSPPVRRNPPHWGGDVYNCYCGNDILNLTGSFRSFRQPPKDWNVSQTVSGDPYESDTGPAAIPEQLVERQHIFPSSGIPCRHYVFVGRPLRYGSSTLIEIVDLRSALFFCMMAPGGH